MGWPVSGGNKLPTCLVFVLGQGVRDDGVGMSMAHPMIFLQHGNQLHVPGRITASDQGLPMGDGVAILLLDRREVGGWAFERCVGHVPMKVGQGR